MDLVQYVRLDEAITPDDFAKVEDVYGVLTDFLHKRASRSAVDRVRTSLLIAARRLYANTTKLNALIDDPKFLKKVNALAKSNRLKGYWASRLLSLPLLNSAMHQLQQAKTVHDAVLAIVRLIGVVEDQEEPVSAPYVPPVQGGKLTYHNAYKYLLSAAGWPADEVQAFNENLAFFGDKAVQRLAEQVRNGTRVNRSPKPYGW